MASGGLLLWSGALLDQQLVPQWPRWLRAFQSRSVASLSAYAFATTSPTSTLSSHGPRLGDCCTGDKAEVKD